MIDKNYYLKKLKNVFSIRDFNIKKKNETKLIQKYLQIMIFHKFIKYREYILKGINYKKKIPNNLKISIKK